MKRISILLVAALITMALAACQNNQAPSEQATPAVAPPESAAPIVSIDPTSDDETIVAIRQDVIEIPDDANPLPDGITPFEMYVPAMRQLVTAMAEAEAFQLSMYTGFRMYVGDTLFSKESDILLWRTDADVKIDMITSSIGEQAAAIIYFRDGIAYTDTEGIQTQRPASLEDIFAEAGISQADLVPMDLIDFDMNDIIEQRGFGFDGGYELIFALDPSTMHYAVDRVVSLLDTDTDDISIQPASADFFVNLDEDHNLTLLDLFVTFHIDIDGELAQAGLVFAVEYRQIGDVTIDFPEDLNTFTEM